MKPLSSLLFPALLFTSFLAGAQCPSDKYQWDFSVSYGMMTTGISYTDDNQDASKTISQFPRPAFFTLRYFLYNRLAVGAAIGTASEQGTYYDPYHTGTAVGTYTAGSTTVAVELYYIYFFRKYVEVYTFAGAGPAFTSVTSAYSAAGSTYPSQTSDRNILKGQYTPIGIRAGGRLGVYAELGYGYKGVLNAGLSFKLGPPCWWNDHYR